MRFTLLAVVGILFIQTVSAMDPPEREHVDPKTKRAQVLQYLKEKQDVLPPFGEYAKPKPAPKKLMEAQNKALCVRRYPQNVHRTHEVLALYSKGWMPVHEIRRNMFLASNGAEYADVTMYTYDELDIDAGYPTLRELYEHSKLKKAAPVRQYRRIELYDEFLVVVREPVSFCTFKDLFTKAKKQDAAAREETAQYVAKQLISGLSELRRLGFYYYYPKVDKISMVVDTKGRVRPKFEDPYCIETHRGACANLPEDDAPITIDMQQENMWTVGELLYQLYTDDEHVLAGYYDKWRQWHQYAPARVNFKPRVFRHVSKEGMDVLKGMLNLKPSKRWTYRQVLGSEWLQQQ